MSSPARRFCATRTRKCRSPRSHASSTSRPSWRAACATPATTCDHRAAHRSCDRRAPLVGGVSTQVRRRVRDSGGHRDEHRECAARRVLAGRATCDRATADVFARSLRPLSPSKGTHGKQCGSRHELLDRAIALDPNFAAAYAAKARMLFREAGQQHGRQCGSLRGARSNPGSSPRVCGSRARARSPGEPLALAVLATLDVQQWRWSRISADQDMRVVFNPATVWMHAWAGNPQLVLPASEQWARLDPNVSSTHLNLGVLYAYAGDREARIAPFDAQSSSRRPARWRARGSPTTPLRPATSSARSTNCRASSG